MMMMSELLRILQQAFKKVVVVFGVCCKFCINTIKW